MQPAAATSMLSTRAWTMRRDRPAPSAARTVSSRRRAAFLNISRLPTFVQVVSSTTATSAIRASRAVLYRSRSRESPWPAASASVSIGSDREPGSLSSTT